MKTWHYADQENRPKQISDAEIQPLVNSGEIFEEQKAQSAADLPSVEALFGART
ncbi:hypothetical protein N9B64_01445 [bacterium]|nr:hypothetical protein [bacterium]